jgi:hypothetical protein
MRKLIFLSILLLWLPIYSISQIKQIQIDDTTYYLIDSTRIVNANKKFAALQKTTIELEWYKELVPAYQQRAFTLEQLVLSQDEEIHLLKALTDAYAHQDEVSLQKIALQEKALRKEKRKSKIILIAGGVLITTLLILN